MLATLERGVQGGRWYSLIDKVWKEETLQQAARAVIRNKGAGGIDGQSTEAFKAEGAEAVRLLSRQLREDRYQPRPVKRVWIDKLGSREKRPLGIPTIRDRVVQTALVYVMEPIFERDFAEHSYGFRPERNAQQAIQRVEHLLREGNTWIVDADLKGYFDNIPQDKLLSVIGEKIADGCVLRLVQQYLQQGVMESGKGWTPTERGTPQGAVLSPLLANAYLNGLDHQMVQGGYEMTRYADDFVIQCRTREQAEAALAAIEQWTKAAGLTLHPQKTRIVDASQPGGFEFLGWHFERGSKWPREKSVKRFKEVVREQTRRHHGESLTSIVEGLNRRLRGWARYFSGGQGDIYTRLDEWIRMRLRSILRTRDGRSGCGYGNDHYRYPNAYFTELRLISLEASARVKRASPA
jgi:RNA-directed DNA polymerase